MVHESGVRMNEHDEAGPAEGSMPELPSSVLCRFAGDSQVDFEIAFYRGILDRDPNYLDVLRILGNNLSAKGLHAESLDIDQRIVRIRPRDEVALYNLACSYSMVGMVDSSLDSLRRAIESGYNEFDYMRCDSDLEATRRDPRFRVLLNSFGVV